MCCCELACYMLVAKDGTGGGGGDSQGFPPSLDSLLSPLNDSGTVVVHVWVYGALCMYSYGR